jgi:hypothetical protein
MDAFLDTDGHTPAPAYAYAGSDLPVVSAFAPDPRIGEPLTSRREMFCRCYVAFGNAAEAARRAGYADGAARQTGHRLLADDAIQARIEELWAHAEGVRETDRDLLVDKTERLFEASLADKGYHAAARALTLQARLAGFGGPASEREPVVPGRPGPVARAAARKAARAEAGSGASRANGGAVSAEPGARQEDAVAAIDAGGPTADAAPAADTVPAPDAPASRPAAVTPWQQTAVAAAPSSAGRRRRRPLGRGDPDRPPARPRRARRPARRRPPQARPRRRGRPRGAAGRGRSARGRGGGGVAGQQASDSDPR